MFFLILKYVWISVNIILLAFAAISDSSWVERYKKINWKLIPFNILVIITTAFVAFFLFSNFPKLMGFGIPRLLQLIFNQNAESIPSTNINLLGVEIKYLGILICILIMTAIPKAAEWEEEKFRKGTKNWIDGFLRSILFGFFHMMVFVPLGAAIALIIPGLFFTFLYFKGNEELSSQGHFQHNLILLSILLFLAILNSFSLSITFL